MNDLTPASKVIDDCANMTAAQASQIQRCLEIWWETTLHDYNDAHTAAVDAVRTSQRLDNLESVIEALDPITREPALDAAVEAVFACLARDLISEREFLLLTGPWVMVMGEIPED